MLALICFFGVLVLKKVSLPSEVILVFGGLGLVLLLLAGLRSPAIPLYVLIAYLPFSRVLVGGFGAAATALNLTNILALLVLGAHAVRQMAQGKPLFQGAPLNRVIWLFVILSSVSLIGAGWTYGSWYLLQLLIPLKRWLTPTLFYFVALWTVREKPTLKSAVILMMFTVTLVAAMAAWDYFNTNASASLDKTRVGGIAVNPNTLGAFFNYYMFLFLGFFLVYPKKLRVWLLVIPLAICFRGIMVTFSRGAYLGFAMGSLAVCFFRKKLLFVVAVAALATAILNPWMLPAGIRYRMGQTITNRISSDTTELAESLESSAANRVIIWKGALHMIQDHPWWGVGYGAFPQWISAYTGGKEVQRDAHNSYLLIAAEMGIPTLLVFLLVLVVAGYYTWWLYRHTQDKFFQATALGFLAGLCALLVANMFGSRMDAQEATGYFWILCGLIMRAVLMERQAQKAAAGQRIKAASRARRVPSTISVQPA